MEHLVDWVNIVLHKWFCFSRGTFHFISFLFYFNGLSVRNKLCTKHNTHNMQLPITYKQTIMQSSGFALWSVVSNWLNHIYHIYIYQYNTKYSMDIRNAVETTWPVTTCQGLLGFSTRPAPLSSSLNSAVSLHRVETRKRVFTSIEIRAPHIVTLTKCLIWQGVLGTPYSGIPQNSLCCQHVALCNSGQPLWHTFRVRNKISNLHIFSGKGT